MEPGILTTTLFTDKIVDVNLNMYNMDNGQRDRPTEGNTGTLMRTTHWLT